MKLKALDTLHISAVKSDPIRPDEEFEVSEGDGKVLIDRGLAKRVAAPKAKKAQLSGNRKAPAARNKADPAADNKAS